ncbi:DUF732 domain-containing protein [Rhodococcus pyridinivorans]|uniref:DUF732 domain-containing protein n=1 Tax=Rhodococcus pyridinivorans TaxID=103816 RepID=UPI002226E73B|nr:DUF732 domain-containing protein [Rhodococcus pyridinivorans]MCW3471007.1 DUF732 domain-containing protein [Rhodococcus pyridinivorans]
MRFPMLLAAALVLPLTACGGSNAQPAPATADNSTAPIARYSNEATARYLSHLEHPILDGRSREELIRWGHLTCDEAYAEGYTPRHTIRDEGGFSDGESLLVSMAAVVELCPDSMSDLTASEAEELETFFDQVKNADTDTLEMFGR